jgi:hypothetical protein
MSGGPVARTPIASGISRAARFSAIERAMAASKNFQLAIRAFAVGAQARHHGTTSCSQLAPSRFQARNRPRVVWRSGISGKVQPVRLPRLRSAAWRGRGLAFRPIIERMIALARITTTNNNLFRT